MLHIPHKSQKKLLFFRLPYLQYNFMTANLVRLNLAVLKISETSRNAPVVECYVCKIAGIHSPITLDVAII